MITPDLHLFRTERLQVRPLQDLDLKALCAVYGDAGATGRAVATAAPANVASRRVLLKAGLSHVATRCDRDGSAADLFAWEVRSG